MTVKQVVKHCKRMQADESKDAKDKCAKCMFWKAQTGCMFYARPIDWDEMEEHKINEQM